MLRIRLRRQGKTKQPTYRIVVAESHKPRDGAFVETLGTYNPLTQPETFEVNEDRLRHWVGNGAMPSETVQKLLTRKGIESGAKVRLHGVQDEATRAAAAANAAPKQSRKAQAKAAAAAAAPPAAAATAVAEPEAAEPEAEAAVEEPVAEAEAPAAEMAAEPEAAAEEAAPDAEAETETEEA